MSATLETFAREGARTVFPFFPLRLRREMLYFRVFGSLIPREPVTFLEKIQWRILKDRRELIARGGDKIKMKDHAASADAAVIIPETLWCGEDLASIADVDWGCEWVLKPRTGSGHVLFGQGSLADSNISSSSVSNWRHKDQFEVKGEWAYGEGKDGYLIERRIPTIDGESPNDLRFFVFDGEVKVIQIDTPRFSEVRRRFYTADWEPLEVQQGGKALAAPVPAPERLSIMKSIASAIGSGFDFIRVDLYDVPSGIYFGELTPYPTGGLSRFSDANFDRELGSYWTLPKI